MLDSFESWRWGDGCADSTAFESLERIGSVPWHLFEAEKRWRELLQSHLDDVYQPAHASVEWLQGPDAVTACRRKIGELIDQRADLRAELAELDDACDRARAELARVRAQIEQERQDAIACGSAIDRPRYQLTTLDAYLDDCRRYAIAEALRQTQSPTRALTALGVARSTFYRFCDRYGLTPQKRARRSAGSESAD